MRHAKPTALARQRGEVDLLDLREAACVEHLHADAELRRPVAAHEHGLSGLRSPAASSFCLQRLQRDVAAVDRQACRREAR
jgi:hypothetical protein